MSSWCRNKYFHECCWCRCCNYSFTSRQISQALILVLSGYSADGTCRILNELGFMKSFMLPIPKIKRNSEKCSDCNLCDSKCPQGIKISQMPVVNHVDCNLCTDCVYHCPLKNVLTVNKKKNLKYLAPVALVILIALSFTAASFYELTTISVKWGKSQGTNAVYKQSGLKNVKCFGSSMALKGTLENIDGIYGLDTYAKSHTVKVYYDPAVISEKKVKASLFIPQKSK